MKVCCPRPQRRSVALQQQEIDRFTLVNPLFDNPPIIKPPPRQCGNGDLFAISRREPERNRRQCLSDHFHPVVAAGYRRRV
jgi:hypothetical protein